jgi:nitrate/nitrite-specific signal transduction histidine kinase
VAERERIARELHDTLLQGVQGLILRFQAVATRASLDPATRAELDAVLERGDDVVAAARDRVIDLRAQSAAAVDLGQALAPLATQGRADTQPPPVVLRITGKPRPVAAGVAEECLAVAQEAVENAPPRQPPKSSRLRCISARALILHQRRWRGLCRCAMRRGGHFGLVGMRERWLAARADRYPQRRAGRRGGAVARPAAPPVAVGGADQLVENARLVEGMAGAIHQMERRLGPGLVQRQANCTGHGMS